MTLQHTLSKHDNAGQARGERGVIAERPEKPSPQQSVDYCPFAVDRSLQLLLIQREDFLN